MIIKTVLKSGGEYKPEHVQRIYDMIRKHVKFHYDFVCYSDLDFPFAGQIRKLYYGWPNWWSKLEIFRDIEDSFYIDLDMTIHGDITDIVSRSYDFAALSNMNPRIAGIGSAMMAWSGNKRFLYDSFRENPHRYIAENKSIGTEHWGDQGFINSKISNIERFQKIFPDRIKRFNESGPADIRVFYGRHRPWQ